MSCKGFVTHRNFAHVFMRNIFQAKDANRHMIKTGTKKKIELWFNNIDLSFFLNRNISPAFCWANDVHQKKRACIVCQTNHEYLLSNHNDTVIYLYVHFTFFLNIYCAKWSLMFQFQYNVQTRPLYKRFFNLI